MNNYSLLVATKYLSKIKQIHILAQTNLRVTSIFIVVLFLSISTCFSQDVPEEEKILSISDLGVGIEYAHNSELGFLAHYKYKNLALFGSIRRCTHDEKIYFTPGVKYYFRNSIYGIIPVLNLRYGKLHYDRSWSSTTYDYQITYVWDAAMQQMMPMVSGTGSTSKGKSIINSPALSFTGGGEYNIKNFGINTGVGMSYYTKIDGDFKDKGKFFFTIGVLYYFEKKKM